jgi:hypothetical protein
MNLAARLPWRNLRERRQAFLSTRGDRRQPDDQFVAAVAPEAAAVERQLVAAIRGAVALACELPAEALHAADGTTELERLFGAERFGEFLLAIPFGIPESADGLEFLQYLDEGLATVPGDHGGVTLDLYDQAVVEWRSAGLLGAWCAWLAREVATPARSRPR